ncbi:MAG: glycosyltransferase family 2 protein [Chloroflexi bacterium]|nr:glycosyltransferase family 2 protein [Chloroflexota bacterium]MCY3937704.1 glycosyltransferase family 2 protein [Chloroflexota bacterium]
MNETPQRESPPDVSIVIVTFDVLPQLRRCLQSIPAALNGLRYELTVVENGYGDGTWEWLVGHEDVRAIRGSPAIGFGSAVNKGLAGAKGRFFLILNPDTLLPPAGVAQLAANLDRDPGIGIVGPKLVRSTGELDRASRRSFPTPVTALTRMLRLDAVFPGKPIFGGYNLLHLDPDRACDVDAVAGAFMFIRGEVFRSLGGFDEGFWMYGEDLDLCYRTHQLGWRVRYAPEVEVLHEKGASSSRRRLKTRYEFYRAMARFYRKHQAPRQNPALNMAVLAAIFALGSAGVGKEIVRYAARLATGSNLDS